MNFTIISQQSFCKYCLGQLKEEKDSHQNCLQEIKQFNKPPDRFSFIIDKEEGFMLIHGIAEIDDWFFASTNICPIWMNLEVGKEVLKYLNLFPDVIYKKDAMNALRWLAYKKQIGWIE